MIIYLSCFASSSYNWGVIRKPRDCQPAEACYSQGEEEDRAKPALKVTCQSNYSRTCTAKSQVLNQWAASCSQQQPSVGPMTQVDSRGFILKFNDAPVPWGAYVKLRGRGVVGERQSSHWGHKQLPELYGTGEKGVWGMNGLTLRITREIMSSGEIQVSTGMRQRRMYLRQSFQGFLAAEQALQKTSFRLGVREAPREGCPAELSPALKGIESSVILKTRNSGNWEVKSQDINTTNWWNWQPQDYNWNLGMNLCKCLHKLLLQIPAVHLIALGLSGLWRLASWTNLSSKNPMAQSSDWMLCKRMKQ